MTRTELAWSGFTDYYRTELEQLELGRRVGEFLLSANSMRYMKERHG